MQITNIWNLGAPSECFIGWGYDLREGVTRKERRITPKEADNGIARRETDEVQR
jgi:hypothetical protein